MYQSFHLRLAIALLTRAVAIGGCSSLPHFPGYTYAPSFHPYYDSTGQSIVFWFTCAPNIIQAVNVVSNLVDTTIHPHTVMEHD